MDNTEKIMNYLIRLKNKENIDEVKKEFIKDFKDVDPKEIIKAEESLIKSGIRISEIKGLCDIHSALFHGLTKQEKAISQKKENIYKDKTLAYLELTKEFNHPLSIFHKENEQIKDYLQMIKNNNSETLDFMKLKNISLHYAKKGDLIYPHLKTKYNVTGPSDVMWTVDDEIRDSINKFLKEKKNLELLSSIVKRAEEMIYKEENILFPICAINFSDDDWIKLSFDALDYDEIFGVKNEKYKNFSSVEIKQTDESVLLSGGHMKIYELDALLNTLPFEISFVDSVDINRYFNLGEKYFKRPTQAIDRSVYSCHPPKVEMMVRGIINEFRNGKKDFVQVWMEKKDIPMLVSYYAVRNKDKEYLGTMEVVQNMEFAKKHFQKK